MFDGREVSELERQFLFSWKAMRKARLRYQQQMIGTDDVSPHYIVGCIQNESVLQIS